MLKPSDKSGEITSNDPLRPLCRADMQTSGDIRATQRSAEEELVRTKETLDGLQRQHQLIFESVGEGLHGIDLAGNIIFENLAAATMLGWNVQDVLGRHAHSLIHHTRADGSPYPPGECHILRHAAGRGCTPSRRRSVLAQERHEFSRCLHLHSHAK